MKRKKLCLILLLCGILMLGIGAAAPIIFLERISPSVGIIGGAGMPIYQAIMFHRMNGWPFCLILLGIAFIIVAAFCLIFRNTVSTHGSVKTTLIAVGSSAVTSLGSICVFVWYSIAAFHEASKHPIEYPMSIACGGACLCLLVVLLAFYCKERGSHMSGKGIAMDLAVYFLFLPVWFFLFSFLYSEFC